MNQTTEENTPASVESSQQQHSQQPLQDTASVESTQEQQSQEPLQGLASVESTQQPSQQQSQQPSQQHSQRLQCSDEVRDYLLSRGISPETALRAEIHSGYEWMPQTRRQEQVIIFDYKVDGQVVNAKYRSGRKHFKLMPNAPLVPWRIDSILDEDTCFITEGEMDALSLMQIGIDNVISVPNGASTNLTYLDEFIQSHFENKITIYIAVDSDMKGRELCNELVRRLGEDRCRIMSYGEGCKDANELLMKHGGRALYQAIVDAREVAIQGTFTARDLRNEVFDLYLKGMPKGAIFGMGELDDYISIDLGRLAALVAKPGDGKSEFTDQIMCRLNALYGWKVAYFSPENFPIQLHIAKLVEKFWGCRMNKDEMTEHELDECINYISDNFFHIMPEDDYSVETIIRTADALIRRHGIRCLVIDPYNSLEHKIPQGQSETNYINDLLERLRNFTRRKQIVTWLVTHPTKLKKDAAGKWPMPTLYDICGSAAFYNKCDFGLSMQRVDALGYTEVAVEKVKFRHLGHPGSAFFRFQDLDGRFINIPEPGANGGPLHEPEWDHSNWIRTLAYDRLRKQQDESQTELPFAEEPKASQSKPDASQTEKPDASQTEKPDASQTDKPDASR